MRPRDGTPGEQPGDEKRRQWTTLHRRWTTSDVASPKRVMGGQAPWLDGGNLALLIGIGLAVPLAYLDSVWWTAATAPTAPGRNLPAPPLAICLPVVFLLHGVVIDRFLAAQTRQERTLPIWLRALRSLVAGLPFLGLYAVPAWRWFLRSRLAPGHGAAAAPPGSPLTVRGRLSPWPVPGSRWLVSPGSIVFLFIIDIVFFAWLALSPPTTSRPALLLLSTLLHLFAFLGIAVHLWQRARSAHASLGQRIATGLLALFWLMPIPLLPLLGIAAYVLLPTPDADSLLTRRAYERRTGAAPLPGLTATLAESWAAVPWWRRIGSRTPRLDRHQDPGDRERRIGWLYRVKSGMLPLDAALLAMLLHAFLGGLPRPLVVIGYLSAGLGLAALIWLAVHSLLRLLDPPGRERVLERHPYPRYLALTQLGFAGGLLLGDGLASEAYDQVAFALVAGGLAGTLATFLPIVLPLPEPVPKPTPQERLVPQMLFITAAIVGLQFADPERYEEVRRLLGATVRYFPALGMLTAAALVPYLVQPFHTRQAFTRELPGDIRRAVAVLTGSAVLPLGGLLVPLWIHYRHRRWAEYERRWLEMSQDSERHPSG